MDRLHRRRMVNAVLFFAQNTRVCGKIKLFKLLYLLDFEHFRITGKSVTGFDYQAWKFGPVPVDLMEEWEVPARDLREVVHVVEERVVDYTRQSVVPNDGVEFDDDDFTPRQLRIMREIAERYRDAYSPEMIDVTHLQNGAWDKVWRGGEGARERIPYALGIPETDPNREQVLSIAAELASHSAAEYHYHSQAHSG